MSDSSKQTDIVTDILDAAFDKPWEVYSNEEYKHQIEETKAAIREATPEQVLKQMNKRMNLRVQATALYRKDRHKSKATRKRYFQAFCYACDYLADTCNLQKVSNITPTHFARLQNIGSHTKHRVQFSPSFPVSVNTANMPVVSTKCLKTRN